MSNLKPIAAGFALIILMLIIIGGSAVYLFKNIASDVDNIYNHPFAVSNAAKDIKFHLVSMHRQMKNVAEASTPEQVRIAAKKVTRHERAVLDNFEIIFDKFLGEKALINNTYTTFITWKPVREEVIKYSLIHNSEKAAAINKNQGARHVALLNRKVDELAIFAFNKAEEFHRRAKANEKRAFIIMTTLILLTVGAALFIAFHVIRNLLKTAKRNAQREHLIDQNIMMATLDMDGNIINLSNALCRFLGRVKQDLIGTQSGFFDNSGDSDQSRDTIWNVVHTGKAWTGEIENITPTGQVRWAKSSILPNLGNHFQVDGFTNILTDITSKKLSVTDELTNLSNRRQYEKVITRETRLARRNGTSITLAIADIDFFKNYNDNYGHPAGDKVLSQVAEQMLATLKRPNDYIFRIGGEEFAFIFSNLNAQESEGFLNEIRQAVENLHITHDHSKISNNVTISIGAHSMLSGSALTEEDAYIMADKALYAAKRKRNEVVVTS